MEMLKKVTCKCGKDIKFTTSADTYRLRLTDSEGKITYEICPHGIVLVDKLNKDKKDADIITESLSLQADNPAAQDRIPFIKND
jgi:hypothetical protein